MTNPTITLAALLAAAALAAGCANRPGAAAASPPASSAGTDCAQLQADIASTQQARHQAQQDEQNAWKALVPFAVAGRYAKARSAAGDADKRLALLQATSDRLGCGPQGS